MYAKDRLVKTALRLFPYQVESIIMEFDNFMMGKIMEKDISPALRYCLDHIAWANI